MSVGEMCVDMCALTQPHTHTMLLKTTENVYPVLRNNQVTGRGPELFQTRIFCWLGTQERDCS